MFHVKKIFFSITDKLKQEIDIFTVYCLVKPFGWRHNDNTQNKQCFVVWKKLAIS